MDRLSPLEPWPNGVLARLVLVSWLHVTWLTNARSATLTTVKHEAQALETVGDSADRQMEVPGVSDNVQVSERV